MSRLNKEERKGLLREVKRREKLAAFADLPISNAQFSDLFESLQETLLKHGCDKTRRLTMEIIRKKNLPEERLLEWFDQNSGFCGCEVLANSKQVWEACNDVWK